MNDLLEREVEIRRNAWRAERIDELHSDSKLLAQAIDDSTYRQSPGALEDLLGALISYEPNATALDRVVLQHQAAMTVIDRLVKEVVESEEKRKEFL